MSEAQQEANSRRSTAAPIDAICDSIREGLEQMADFFTPPQSAIDHFRESRIEVLRGVRDILDHRIERLSRRRTQGTRVTVD
jgi:hypothetical protein